jgi:O-antigen/teichoic acid export membrane protein
MRWILNIATSYLRFVIAMVLVFFLTPFIVSKIGIDLFGLWSLIFSVVGLFGLLDLGFATAAVKYMAEFTGSADRAGRNQVLSTLLVIYTALGLVCLLAVALVASQAGHWFDLGPQERRWLTLALWCLGSAVAINLPMGLFKAILMGSGRMALVNGVELSVQLINAAATVVLLNAGLGLLALIAVTTLTMLLGPLLLAPFAYRFTPGLSLDPRGFSRGRVRELLSFSFYFFISNIAVLVILRIDPVVIKAFLPLAAVAVYAIGAKVAEYTYYLNKQFSNALMPLVSQSRGGGDDATITRVLTDGTRFGLAIAVPFVALLFWYAEAIVLLWMGEEFAGAVPVLRILLGAILCTAVQLNAANVLAMNGKHRFIAFAMAGSAAINLILSIALIQPLGLQGVAIATLIAAFSVELLVIVPRACRARRIGIWEFFRGSVAPSLPPLVPALALAWGLGELKAPDAFLWILVEGAASALVYFAAFWALSLKPTERRLVTAKLARRRAGAPAGPGDAG